MSIYSVANSREKHARATGHDNATVHRDAISYPYRIICKSWILYFPLKRFTVSIYHGNLL